MARIRQHDWEKHDSHCWGANSDDETSSQDAAAHEFMELLLEEYFSGIITAMTFCLLCHYAHAGGLAGDAASKYGMPPGRSSGKYKAHLDDQLHFKRQRRYMYHYDVPGRQRRSEERCSITLAAKPAHETLESDYKNPSYSTQLREAIREGLLPPSYDDHPVVLENPTELVAVVGIYMDALPYSQVDSVLGVWAINLVTGARHVMMLLRKRMACACGCRGWCTYHGILHFIHWVIQCLASGSNPLQRHDGSSFKSSFHDELRSQAAGTALTFKTAVLKLKGDWQEFAERLGFPNWSSGIRPCFCCNACGDELYDPTSCSLFACGWQLNSDDDYDRACSRCELWIVLTSSEELRSVVGALYYDRRKDS